MPFDRESFIKGYMTGLNLSRAPGGQGRKPDVPSGKYILAEDGTKIITEKMQTSGVTFYPANITVFVQEGSTQDTYFKNESETAVYYFLAIIDGQYRSVILTKTDADGKIEQYNGYGRPPDREVQWFLIMREVWYKSGTAYWTQDIVLKQAGIYYYALNYPVNPADLRVVPNYESISRFEGTREELDEYIASLSYIPLITE